MTSSPSAEKAISGILKFWFEEISPEAWFKKDTAFDDQLKQRFGMLVEQALAGQLDKWADSTEGRLALILLLDQMTRNIYRDTPKAFAGDEMACALSLRAVAEGLVEAEPDVDRRHFLLMPMMHSEDIQVQKQSLPLFKTFTRDMTYEYAVKHHDIVERFDRFPHRNNILGRPSIDEEAEFLKQPGSSF